MLGSPEQHITHDSGDPGRLAGRDRNPYRPAHPTGHANPAATHEAPAGGEEYPDLSGLDWIVVAVLCAASLLVGLRYSRRSTRRGTEGYFAGNRDLPWWAIGLSNTATYQSGNGAFVALLLAFGLAGNWFWWTSWIIWMPLVAIVWAPLWRRMRITTTAELIGLRYGGRPAVWARKSYAAVCCFGFAILIIAYITGFFAKTIAPLTPLSETQILLIFGGVTAIYTMFGGLLGVVYVDVVQFAILLVGNTVLLAFVVPQCGGWEAILERAGAARPEALAQTPPTRSIGVLTVVMLALQGLFFAGSPTAGEGMTAQRFMAARSEWHAIAGQLFNAFLALTLRTLPLIGLGIVALGLYWTPELAAGFGQEAQGTRTMIDDPAYAWAELVKHSRLPPGLIGVLVAAEAAAYMSTLSSLINWGGSFVVNDLLPPERPGSNQKRRIWVSRLTTLMLFIFAAIVTMRYVGNVVSWFQFINAAMVSFLLPLCWLRFFWWRFNAWGELSAIMLGLPLAIIVWFVLGFEHRPLWQALSLLLGLSVVTLVTVTLLTPAESDETLRRFYIRCRSPGLWGRVRLASSGEGAPDTSTGRMFLDCAIGVLTCLGFVLATNAVFVGDWVTAGIGVAGAVVLGSWLVVRVLGGSVRA